MSSLASQLTAFCHPLLLERRAIVIMVSPFRFPKQLQFLAVDTKKISITRSVAVCDLAKLR